MTIAVLPSSLVCVLRSQYSHTLGDNRRMTSADDGPPRSKQQMSLSAEAVQLVLDTDLNGRELFGRFYKETVFNGSLPFFMPDPILNNTYLRTEAGDLLLTAAGDPLIISAYWLCMFGEQPPQYQINGVRWKISFTVQVMP